MLFFSRFFNSCIFQPCIFVPHFPVSHFHPLQLCAAFSCPAFSCLAFSASRLTTESQRRIAQWAGKICQCFRPPACIVNKLTFLKLASAQVTVDMKSQRRMVIIVKPTVISLYYARRQHRNTRQNVKERKKTVKKTNYCTFIGVVAGYSPFSLLIKTWQLPDRISSHVTAGGWDMYILQNFFSVSFFWHNGIQ